MVALKTKCRLSSENQLSAIKGTIKKPFAVQYYLLNAKFLPLH